MEFSTLNESNLHKTLKLIYAEQSNGKTEVELYGHVYDILTKNNEIIEIQTGTLVKLLPKILDTINKGHKIKVVYPLVISKTIETYKEGKLISKRKSPKKGNIYSLFKEITGLYPVLLDNHFSLDVVLADISEYREKFEDLVQSANNKRRFRKDWNKTGKKLNFIQDTLHFDKKDDYLKLLPENLPDEFSSKEIKELFIQQKFPALATQSTNLILWVFNHMNLIELTKIENKKKYYKINY